MNVSAKHLNRNSFKYRNYDYAIGRFMSVDPLAEKYPFWTPYAFSGNRLIDARELEGLEPGSIHKTKQEAAINFGQHYNGKSILTGKEIGTRIYSLRKNGKIIYSYVEPNIGTEQGVFIPDEESLPAGAMNEGDAHTHGKDEPEQFAKYGEEDADNKPSEPDIESTKKQGKTGFVITPNGSVIEIDPNTGKYKIISTDVPSDPNSPTRQNNIDPSMEPYEPQKENNPPNPNNNEEFQEEIPD